MKAILYAVRGVAGWAPYLSVAWEVDRQYWMERAFRDGAWEECGSNEAKSAVIEQGDEFVWLIDPLPLGIAESAVERIRREGLATASIEQMEKVLRDSVLWAGQRAGENGAANWKMETERWGVGGEARRTGWDVNAEPAQAQYDLGRALARTARHVAGRLRGRSILHGEASAMLTPEMPGRDAAALLPALQLAALLGGVQLTVGIATGESAGGPGWRIRSRSRYRCRRCGSGEEQLRRTPCASCGRLCAYCEACLTMGRSRECGLLIIGAPAAEPQFSPQPEASASQLSLRWGLSPAQSAAAWAALLFLHGRPEKMRHEFTFRQPRTFLVTIFTCVLSRFRRLFRWGCQEGADHSLFRSGPEQAAGDSRVFLLWAVTGAGKTEMMFPLLDAVLAAGGKAAIATPRRDVVLELAPRLAKAFPDVSQTVLYGGSADRFERGDLTLATTHQLIRFREAFDLVVIDEVDAFPYHNDATLHYAAEQSRARHGTTVLLSATPPPHMQRRAKRGALAHARVAVRHHGRPLPVPRRIAIPPLSQWTGRKRLPSGLHKAIRASVERGAQLFLFVPYIRQVTPLVQRLQAAALGIPPDAIDGTSSQDPERGTKIVSFRARSLRILVTTTILERGITIPKSDVCVLDADKPLFDASSLVQMAGRAGRSAEDPEGLVFFGASRWTESQRQACRQIREMNAYAARKGYLRG